MSAQLNKTPAAAPLHGNQTQVNNVQMKRTPIASDSSLLTLKLTQKKLANVHLNKLNVSSGNCASYGAKTFYFFYRLQVGSH